MQETSREVRILLADDHTIVRDGLRSLIQDQDGMTVVGEAKSGREALKLTEELVPDVVLMDIGMPGLNGVGATRRIKEEHPAIHVIALSMHSDTQFVARMLEAGASGYVLKDCAFDELADALAAVGRGNTYLSPTIAGPLVEDYLRRVEDDEDPDGTPLSPREQEVLQLLAEGLISKQIATRLGVSEKTIETHRSRLMNKLGIRSVAELTKYAIRHGLTELED